MSIVSLPRHSAKWEMRASDAERPGDEPPGQLLELILDPIRRSWPGRLHRVVRQRPIRLLLSELLLDPLSDEYFEQRLVRDVPLVGENLEAFNHGLRQPD